MGMRNKYGNEFLWRVWQSVRLLVAGLFMGCMGDAQSTRSPSRSIVADLVVSVDNQSLHPAVIYVGAQAMSDSLGVVPARAVKSFSLPSDVVRSRGSLRLEARDRAGAASTRSAPFNPLPGHEILWTLDNRRNGAVTIR